MRGHCQWYTLVVSLAKQASANVPVLSRFVDAPFVSPRERQKNQQLSELIGRTFPFLGSIWGINVAERRRSTPYYEQLQRASTLRIVRSSAVGLLHLKSSDTARTPSRNRAVAVRGARSRRRRAALRSSFHRPQRIAVRCTARSEWAGRRAIGQEAGLASPPKPSGAARGEGHGKHAVGIEHFDAGDCPRIDVVERLIGSPPLRFCSDDRTYNVLPSRGHGRRLGESQATKVVRGLGSLAARGEKCPLVSI